MLVYLRDGSAQTIVHAVKVTDQTFYLTQSQYTDNGPNSSSADPVTPSARQGSHWSANVLSRVWLDQGEGRGREDDQAEDGKMT